MLSARSRNVPKRMKCKAPSINIVPSVTPRDRCERNLTHSKNWLGSRSNSRVLIRRCTSSQVWFVVSQTSVVSVPRTARAFSRAAFRQEMMEEGFSCELTMNCVTRSGVISPYSF